MITDTEGPLNPPSIRYRFHGSGEQRVVGETVWIKLTCWTPQPQTHDDANTVISLMAMIVRQPQYFIAFGMDFYCTSS